MTFEEFQRKSRFTEDELVAYSSGALIEGAPANLPPLPGSLLLPFHEIRMISWDASTKTGRIEAVRRNRVDEWFYACHFIGDPVMPGCWGVDAIWQALRFFAAWRGLAGCGKTLGMENVSFFGQIRPHDKEVVYSVDVVSVEEDGGEHLITGKAAVSVDGIPVYTIESAQIGSAYWDSEGAAPAAVVAAPEGQMTRRLSLAEFGARQSLNAAEIIALSQGTLIEPTGGEVSLLPCSLMLEIGRIHRISFDEETGEGKIVSSKPTGPLEWFFPMNHGEKPTVLGIDAVWQMMGVFNTWRQNAGTGRALGFEKVEVFDTVRPEDREILYEIQVVRASKTPSGDAFVRADARVFAGGRLILSGSNFNVGCHKNIRYSDYPQASEMGFGGKLKTRVTPSTA